MLRWIIYELEFFVIILRQKNHMIEGQRRAADRWIAMFALAVSMQLETAREPTVREFARSSKLTVQ